MAIRVSKVPYILDTAAQTTPNLAAAIRTDVTSSAPMKLDRIVIRNESAMAAGVTLLEESGGSALVKDTYDIGDTEIRFGGAWVAGVYASVLPAGVSALIYPAAPLTAMGSSYR